MYLLMAGRVLVRPDRVLRQAAILVDGDRIARVATQAELVVEPMLTAEMVRIDFGEDVTLLPGLIDMHVHLGFDGGPAPARRMQQSSDADLLVLMLHSARQLLGAGVTTARDLGARSYLDVVVREAIAAGLADGPSLLGAGAPLTTTGGHCWFMGAECDDATALRRRVREHHKAGVDLIKIMATGGFMTPGSAPWHAQFDVAELQVAVDEAHRLGKLITAHAHGAPGIRNALAVGVDGVEHCSWASQGGGRVLDEAVVEQLARQGIAVCPTTHTGWQRLRDRSVRLEHLRRMYQAGVHLVAGTDAGITNVPHAAYVDGLLVLAEAGMSNAEVLEAATARAAAACGLGLVTGALEEGKRADVIAVRGDPLQELGALRRLAWVMARGRPHRVDPTAQAV